MALLDSSSSNSFDHSLAQKSFRALLPNKGQISPEVLRTLLDIDPSHTFCLASDYLLIYRLH